MNDPASAGGGTDTVKIGVIGCGVISGAHLKGIRNLDGVEAAAVCDPNEAQVKKIVDAFGVEKTYTDHRDLLNNPEIAAVVIALPDGLHRPVTIEAAAAGKHILVEKPMALDLAECDAMIDAANEAGVILMVGQVVRRFENHAVAKRWIEEGKIGRLTKISRFRLLKNALPDIRLRPWVADPAMAADWLLYGFGAHEYDAVLWLAGSVMAEVSAHGESALPDYDGWKSLSSTATLANGVTADMSLSLCAEEKRWETVLTGEDGTLTIRPNSLVLNGKETDVPTDDMAAFGVQMAEFVESIRTGKEPGPSGKNVRPTMAMLEAIGDVVNI